jgi:uncharacterized delta-60 repeat protein
MRQLLYTLCIFFATAHSAHGQASFFDPTFGAGGKSIATVDGRFLAIALQPDGKIIAVNMGEINIARFKQNGTADSSFATNGFYDIPYFAILRDVLLQPDGKIIFAGVVSLGGDNYFIMRLNTDGTPDMSFGISGVVTLDIGPGNESAYAIALQGDAKIVVAGNCSPSNIGVVRLKANGVVDSSFGTNGIEKSVYCSGVARVRITSDGKIVVGATAPSTHNYSMMAVRYMPDGSLDHSFNGTGVAYTVAGAPGSNYCRAMKLQPDDKIILTGSGGFGLEGSNFVAIRYNTDGSLDASFGSAGIANVDFDGDDDAGAGIAIAPDGKIVLCGGTKQSGKGRVAMACLANDGTLNTTWGSAGKIISTWGAINDGSSDVLFQPDGKMIVSGLSYYDEAGNSNPGLARYMSYPNFITEAYIERGRLFYPNPAKDKLFFNPEFAENISSVQVISFTGERLYPEFSDNLSLNVSDWPDGLYLFSAVKADGVRTTQKIFMEH